MAQEGARALTFSELVKRVLNDAKFRDALRKDPAEALRQAGVDATREMIDALKAFNWNSAERVALAFDKTRIT
jgi:hypothetical protein